MADELCRADRILGPMTAAPSNIIAACRSALGRVGGLRRNRRLADLAAPVVRAARDGAKLTSGNVDELTDIVMAGGFGLAVLFKSVT